MAKSDKVLEDVKEKKPVIMDWTYIWVAGDGSIRSARYTTTGSTPRIQRFDGSATKQASTDNSDLFLVPVREYREDWQWSSLTNGEISRDSAYVLCEVQTADGTPHASNTRADLRKFLSKNPTLDSVKVGFEQEVLLIDPDTRQPYRWPTGKNDKGETQVVFPGPQGRYYAGNGDFQRGREVIERLADRCSYREVPVEAYSPGICLSQWSYVLGKTDLLTACDNLVFSRYILELTAEAENDPRCVISYQPKSFPGSEWNGNGCNFRVYLNNYIASNGNAALAKSICETLAEDHREHMASYGAGNEQRLVGKTGGVSDYNRFSWGFGDRTASVCVPTIPLNGDAADFSYIEDRRPGANVDPYAGILALSRSLVKVVDLAPPTKADSFEPKLVK